jgi:hypothetical protein
VETVAATAREVLALAGRLTADGVQAVVMESAPDYQRIWVRHEAHCCMARLAGVNSSRPISARHDRFDLTSRAVELKQMHGLPSPAFGSLIKAVSVACFSWHGHNSEVAP